MRILHFAESFSQPTETFIKRYVEKSVTFGQVGVVAFSFQNIGEELKNKIGCFEITGRWYTRKTLKGAARYLGEKITGNRAWFVQLDRAIKTFKPDIIHCHFGNAGILMMQFNRKFKNEIPYVTSFYGYDVSSQPVLDKKYRAQLMKLWPSGAGFFAEGPELAKKITALGGPASKCYSNPLLIPVEDYPEKKTYRSANDPVKFLFVGRFIEKKGFHNFLKAIGGLKDKIGTFSIDIVGAGPLKALYEEIIAEYDLEHAVKWLGMLGHNDIINRMGEYDFLVHPSLTAKDQDSEGGAPTIIIEAQAIGLPVITTDHADIPYVMGYHDFLAKEGDLSSLSQAIENMINCKNIESFTARGINKVYSQHGLKQNTIYEGNLRSCLKIR